MELTKETKNFLKIIKYDYKYIARDLNGKLNAFKTKPVHFVDIWLSKDKRGIDEVSGKEMGIDLSFIKYNNKEPYLITNLLGGNKE